MWAIVVETISPRFQKENTMIRKTIIAELPAPRYGAASSRVGEAFLMSRVKTKLAFLSAVLGVGLAPSAVAQPPGQFAMTGSMTTPRMGHTATLLENGKVLIAGGYQNVPGGQNCQGSLHGPLGDLECVTALNSAELYDPNTGTFSPTGQMANSGLGHSATLLPNGKVLIHWGSSAEIYDPSSGLFRSLDGVFAGGALATLLNNGKVLINGPWPQALSGFPALLFDPVDETFLPTGDYAGTPGLPGAAALLADGRVLVGGSIGCCYDVAQTEIYDPRGDRFSVTAPIFTQSNGTTSLLPLNNGKVLAVAGWDVNDANATPIGAGLYDPSAGTFQTIGNMTMAREDYTATLLPDGIVFIAGGDFAPSATEVYDPATEQFSATPNMIIARAAHTATLLADGRVLIAGGLPGSPATTATAELYSPPSLTPSPVLFSLSGDGTGQGAVWNAETGLIVSPGNPGGAGDVLAMYTTNLLSGGVIPPQVSIGGRLAEILFFGDAPGYQGYYQVNFRVPAGVTSELSWPVEQRGYDRAAIMPVAASMRRPDLSTGFFFRPSAPVVAEQREAPHTPKHILFLRKGFDFLPPASPASIRTPVWSFAPGACWSPTSNGRCYLIVELWLPFRMYSVARV
jgi:uncharacterized protein (TIGR03437 family)